MFLDLENLFAGMVSGLIYEKCRMLEQKNQSVSTH